MYQCKQFHWFLIVFFLVLFSIYSIYYWDRPLAIYLYHLDIKLRFPLVYEFSYLGDCFLYLLLLPLLALIYRYFVPRKIIEIRLWFLWICVLFPSILAGITKTMIGRARPQMWVEYHTYGVFGWHTDTLFQSFPSGHTTAVTGMLIGLMILLPRYKYLWIFLAICLIITRVVLIKHFISDVTLSSVLVFIELGLLFKLMQYFAFKKNLPSDLHRLCCLVQCQPSH